MRNYRKSPALSARRIETRIERYARRSVHDHL